MRSELISRLPMVLALTLALTATPALAQGKGKGQEKKKDRGAVVAKELRERPELRRRDYEDRDDRWEDRDDTRWDEREYGRYEKQEKGPPFCRNGKGHPKHGWRWCEEKGFGRDGSILYGDRDGRYDDRDGRYENRSGDYGRYGSSYDRAHRDFHYQHDRQCRMRAAERPLDIQWQIRVRQDCKRRHDEWHYRAGRAHS